MKPAERAAALVRMADLLDSKGAELRELIVSETGSTGFITDFIQAGGSVGMCRSNAEQIQSMEWLEMGAPSGGPTSVGGSALATRADRCRRRDHALQLPVHAEHGEERAGARGRLHRRAEAASVDAARRVLIAQGAEEAGIPPGVFNVITGHGEVGDELTSHPMVDMVTFTGSTATGRRIMASAAPTVKRVQLELGGKSAYVVLDDRREDYARTVGFGAVPTHCGQGCVITTRLVLPERLLDAYKEGVAAMAPQIKIGDPRDPSSVLGPLIREQQRARVEGYVASGLEQGAELFTGGKRPDGLDKGFYYEPTVFIGTNDLRIAQEEIFGPVMTVIPYSGDDAEAVRIANDSIYGLAGSVVGANTRGRSTSAGRSAPVP